MRTPLTVSVGEVVLLRRFPLRSARGERPERVWVGEEGLDGDRSFSLARTSGSGLSSRALTGRDLPILAHVTARLDDGELVLDTSLAALAAAAGGPVEIRRATARSATERHSGGAAVHLISDGAAAAPGAPVGCDPGERANVVLALDPAVCAAGGERGWVGGRLTLGGVELALTRTPSRCLGVYAEVVSPGWISVGDAVWLASSPVGVDR